MTSAHRLLLVNPNTSVAVTHWLQQEAERVARGRFEIVAVNADSGVAAIETPEDLARVQSAVVATLKAHPAAAAIIGAFGDPGLIEARAADPRPIRGLGECGMLAAGHGGRRFAIVTLGAAMVESIAKRAESLGLSSQVAAIQALPFSIPEVIADREARRGAVAAAVRACAHEYATQTVLLGGAPFAGIAAGLARELGIDVLDGVEACVEATAAAIATG